MPLEAGAPGRRPNPEYLERIGYDGLVPLWLEYGEPRRNGTRVLLHILDQLLLPSEERWFACTTLFEAAQAIRSMRIRGAPAIGICAAAALVLELDRLCREEERPESERWRRQWEHAISTLMETRPTAVNLRWAVERMNRLVLRLLETTPSIQARRLVEAAAEEAVRIHAEDVEACIRMGRHGAELLEELRGRTGRPLRVLTHCNAGALATGGHGTALGMIREGWNRGLVEMVFVDETRPYLQGARLTAWELHREGIRFELVCDDMAGALMKAGEVDVVITGADRICRNGDTANKIGTYSLAVLASFHGLPLVVAAPLSTLDPTLDDGDAIPIEIRPGEEITRMAGVRIAPEGVKARYIGFDVTPAGLIHAIVTQAGVARAPRIAEGLQSFLRSGES